MTEGQMFFTASEAAEFLRYSPTTLAIWRSQAKGPSYVKNGRTVRYRLDDLNEWASGGAAARQVEDTAECHRERRGIAKRPRGRAGAAQRARRLAAEPRCRICHFFGYTRLAEEIDHILPLALGGADSDDNVRALCRRCHAEQTRKRFRNAAQLELDTRCWGDDGKHG